MRGLAIVLLLGVMLIVGVRVASADVEPEIAHRPSDWHMEQGSGHRVAWRVQNLGSEMTGDASHITLSMHPAITVESWRVWLDRFGNSNSCTAYDLYGAFEPDVTQRWAGDQRGVHHADGTLIVPQYELWEAYWAFQAGRDYCVEVTFKATGPPTDGAWVRSRLSLQHGDGWDDADFERTPGCCYSKDQQGYRSYTTHVSVLPSDPQIDIRSLELPDRIKLGQSGGFAPRLVNDGGGNARVFGYADIEGPGCFDRTLTDAVVVGPGSTNYLNFEFTPPCPGRYDIRVRAVDEQDRSHEYDRKSGSFLVEEDPVHAISITRASAQPEDWIRDEPMDLLITVQNEGNQATEVQLRAEVENPHGAVYHTKSTPSGTLAPGQSWSYSWSQITPVHEGRYEVRYIASYEGKQETAVRHFDVVAPDGPPDPDPADLQWVSATVNPDDLAVGETARLRFEVRNVGGTSTRATLEVEVNDPDEQKTVLAARPSRDVTPGTTWTYEWTYTAAKVGDYDIRFMVKYNGYIEEVTKDLDAMAPSDPLPSNGPIVTVTECGWDGRLEEFGDQVNLRMRVMNIGDEAGTLGALFGVRNGGLPATPVGEEVQFQLGPGAESEWIMQSYEADFAGENRLVCFGRTAETSDELSYPFTINEPPAEHPGFEWVEARLVDESPFIIGHTYELKAQIRNLGEETEVLLTPQILTESGETIGPCCARTITIESRAVATEYFPIRLDSLGPQEVWMWWDDGTSRDGRGESIFVHANPSKDEDSSNSAPLITLYRPGSISTVEFGDRVVFDIHYEDADGAIVARTFWDVRRADGSQEILHEWTNTERWTQIESSRWFTLEMPGTWRFTFVIEDEAGERTKQSWTVNVLAPDVRTDTTTTTSDTYSFDPGAIDSSGPTRPGGAGSFLSAGNVGVISVPAGESRTATFTLQVAEAVDWADIEVIRSDGVGVEIEDNRLENVEAGRPTTISIKLHAGLGEQDAQGGRLVVQAILSNGATLQESVQLVIIGEGGSGFSIPASSWMIAPGLLLASLFVRGRNLRR